MKIQLLLDQFGVLFLSILLGFAAAKCKLMVRQDNEILSRIVMNVTLPCSILYSVLGSSRVLENGQVWQMLLVACLTALGIDMLSRLLCLVFRVRQDHQGLCRFLVIFFNIAYIGFPVVRAIFGQEAVFSAAVFNLVYMLLSYTYGVTLVCQTKTGDALGLKELFSPMLIASVVAFALYIGKIEGPDLLVKAMSYVDQVTSPLSLIILGCSLASVSAKWVIGSWRLWAAVAVRMILFPLLCWYCLPLLGISVHNAGVAAILTAMPSAASATMFCARYGNDQATASTCVVVTTLLSMVTTPLLCLLLLG